MLGNAGIIVNVDVTMLPPSGDKCPPVPPHFSYKDPVGGLAAMVRIPLHKQQADRPVHVHLVLSLGGPCTLFSLGECPKPSGKKRKEHVEAAHQAHLSSR